MEKDNHSDSGNAEPLVELHVPSQGGPQSAHSPGSSRVFKSALRVVVPRCRSSSVLSPVESPQLGFGHSSDTHAALDEPATPTCAPVSHNQDLPARMRMAKSFIVRKMSRVSTRRLESHVAHDTVTFHWRQFFEAFAAQLVLPLCALVWACRGRRARLRNTEMLPCQSMCWARTGQFVLVVTAVGLGMLATRLASSPVLTTMVWTTLSRVCVEYLLIRFIGALAYAYMAPATYTWWTTNEVGDDEASVPSDTRKSEYTCAWMFADDAHVTNELYHTAQRLGVDLDATYFDVLPASRLSATCSGVSTSASSRQSCSTDDTPMHLMLQPTESVSVASIAIEALRYAARHNPLRRRARVLATVLALVHAAFTSPWIQAATTGTQRAHMSTPLSVAMVVVLFVADWWFVSILLLCGFAALADYQRVHGALSKLTHLCQYTVPSTARGSNPLPTKPPRLPLLLTDNVFAFLVTRRVLLNVGVRFRKRMQTYMSALLVLVLSMLVYVVGTVMGRSSSTATSWSMLTDLVFVLVLLVSCLVRGAATNKLTQQHVALLHSRALEALHTLTAYRRSIDRHPPVTRTAMRQLEDSLEALRAVATQLGHDHRLRAVTLLGVRATPAAARTLAACCITALSVVARVWLGTAAGAPSVS